MRMVATSAEIAQLVREARTFCGWDNGGQCERYRDGAQCLEHRLADALEAAQRETVRQAHEIASLRLTLGERPSNPVPEPIGCPMPGQCAQVAEIERLQREIGALCERLASGYCARCHQEMYP